MNGKAANGVGKKKLRVAFCHPDLGIGGAERLIVDAALELVAEGHSVHVFTAYHDKRRCFEETRNGSFPVTVYGNWLPRRIFGACQALCVYLRCVYMALMVVLWWGHFDVVITDQVSATIPVFKLRRKSKVLFYCHFPDQLLANKGSWLKQMYRAPLNWLEETTTGMADLILVNSSFTAAVFHRTFTRLSWQGVQPAILYPSVDTAALDVPPPAEDAAGTPAPVVDGVLVNGSLEAIDGLQPGQRVFLSINRFERKKNIGLAISAYKLLLNALSAHPLDPQPSTLLEDEDRGGASGSQNGPNIKLVVAGGFDMRLAENREVLDSLRRQVEAEGLQDLVIFLPSFTHAQKKVLLAAAIAVVYTPQDEHFGIVPLEAMGARRPVLACNSGGPTESIEHTVTGLLCEPTATAFAKAMEMLLRQPGMAKRMGESAFKHVEAKFSRKVFGEQLNHIIQELVAADTAIKKGRKQKPALSPRT